MSAICLAFTTLERDILAWFISGHPNPEVRSQAASALPTARQITPSGVFVDLRTVGKTLHFPDGADSGWLDGPEICSSVLSHGASSLLHVLAGQLHLLEIVSHVDGHPSEVTNWVLSPPIGAYA